MLQIVAYLGADQRAPTDSSDPCQLGPQLGPIMNVLDQRAKTNGKQEPLIKTQTDMRAMTLTGVGRHPSDESRVLDVGAVHPR